MYKLEWVDELSFKHYTDLSIYNGTFLVYVLQHQNVMAFAILMRDPLLQDATWRYPRRSPAHTTEMPRVVIDVLFPPALGEFDLTLIVQALRPRLPLTTFFGSQALYTATDALILDLNNTQGIHHVWPLCSQLLLLSSRGPSSSRRPSTTRGWT